MRVKICGITNIEDARLCQSYGADALGFIFHRKSPRYIPISRAAAISAELSVFISKIGVFVNESPEFINEAVKKAGLTAVQLHGDEPPDIIGRIDRPVIKTFRIKSASDFSKLQLFEKSAILLDSYSDQVYGGSGSAFNWDLIPAPLRSRIILAGGISSENIEKIYMEIKPAGVDLSSSLEMSPGRKDPQKVKAFFLTLQRLTKLS